MSRKFKVGQVYRVGELPHESECTGNIIKITDVENDGSEFSYKTIRGKDLHESATTDSKFAQSLTLLTGKEISDAIKGFNKKKAKPKPAPSVKEVKRHAKDGEYIKIVYPCEAAGYKNGDILHVTGDFNGVLANGVDVCILDKEYVVLEGYKPPKQKRIYTEFEVAKAKRIVLNTIRELAENHKYVSFSTINDEKDFSGFYAYVYGGKGCRLGIAPKVGLIVNKYERAKAKCSPNDEPNEWIGKCVALCKALHRPIPAFIMGED